MSSEVITAVVIFLPLSSLWASASVESRFQDSKEKNFGNRLLGSNSSGFPATPAGKKGAFGSLASPSDTATMTRTSGSATSSPRALGGPPLLKDLEAQNLAH